MKTNIAFDSEATAQNTRLFPLQNENMAYIGEPKILELVNKTKDGKTIEDFTKKSSVSNTAFADIKKERIFVAIEEPFQKYQQPISHSMVVKQWHGYIKSIEDDEFTAVLTDQSGKTPDIIATFSLSEVSESERDLVCENARFDWIMSRERKLHGTIENKDFLIFNRIPMWKKSDLDIKSVKVEAFNDWLNAGTSVSS